MDCIDTVWYLLLFHYCESNSSLGMPVVNAVFEDVRFKCCCLCSFCKLGHRFEDEKPIRVGHIEIYASISILKYVEVYLNCWETAKA